MALKALMLRKKINEATKKLEELRAKDVDFEKREKELEAAKFGNQYKITADSLGRYISKKMFVHRTP